jgi:hypothetical protein
VCCFSVCADWNDEALRFVYDRKFVSRKNTFRSSSCCTREIKTRAIKYFVRRRLSISATTRSRSGKKERSHLFFAWQTAAVAATDTSLSLSLLFYDAPATAKQRTTSAK